MDRSSYRRLVATALVCILTVLAISACGSSNVSSALKTKVNNQLITGAGLSKSQAAKVTACLLPTFKAHHVLTVAQANAVGAKAKWLPTAVFNCSKKVALESLN